MVEASRRTVVGLALAVAFIVSRHGFAKFHRTLNQCLGIQAISKNRFFEVVKLIYPHIQDILTEMCDEEKAQMKRIDSNVLESWQPQSLPLMECGTPEAILAKMAPSS